MYPFIFLLFLIASLGCLAFGWFKRNSFVYLVGCGLFTAMAILVFAEGIDFISGVNVDTGVYTFDTINAANDLSILALGYFLQGLSIFSWVGLFLLIFADFDEED